MAESKIAFVVDAEMGKAVQAFLKLGEAQRKAETGFERVAQKGKAADDRVSGMVINLGRLAGGYLAFSTLKAGAEGYAQMLEKVGEQIIKLQKDTAGLMTEGENVFSAEKVRNLAFAFSGGWGVPMKEMSDTMGTLQNAFGDLEKGKGNLALQTTLELNDALGGSADATALVTKAMQAYGSSGSLDTVGKATDKLHTFLTALSGVEDPAQLLAAVAPEADRMGASFEDVAASLTFMTQQGGKTKATGAAVQAMFKGVADAKQQGLVKTTDDFATALQRLSKADPQTLQKLFGDAAYASIARLLRSLPEFRLEIERLKAMTGGDVSSRRVAQLRDPVSFTSKTIQDAKNLGVNIDSIQSVENRKAESDYELRKLGAAYSFGPAAKQIAFDKAMVWMSTWLPHGLDMGDPLLEGGKNLRIQSARQGGNKELEELLKVEYGKMGYEQNGQMQWVPTGEKDRERFIDLRNKFGGHLSSGQYAKLRHLELAVDEAKSQPGAGDVGNMTNRRRTENWMNARVESSNYQAQLEKAARMQVEAAEIQKKTAEEQQRRMRIQPGAPE